MKEDSFVEGGFSDNRELADTPSHGAVDVAVEAPPTEAPPASREDVTPGEERVSGQSEIGQLRGMLISLSDQLAELSRQFTTKIQFDESKQRQLDMMHRELEQHRQGMVAHIVRPVLMDLISLYDDLTGMVEGNADKSPQVADALRKQQQSVVAILGKHGVDVYSSFEDTFDRARQRVIGVVETSDERLDQRVARRHRVGFVYEERTLRPEWVETFRYRRPAE